MVRATALWASGPQNLPGVYTFKPLPLLGRLKERHAEILVNVEHLCGDKGYDCEENYRVLFTMITA